MARTPSHLLVGLWAGATGIAVGMSTAGVNLVAQQVTAPVPVIIPGDLTDDPIPEVSMSPSPEIPGDPAGTEGIDASLEAAEQPAPTANDTPTATDSATSVSPSTDIKGSEQRDDPKARPTETRPVPRPTAEQDEAPSRDDDDRDDDDSDDDAREVHQQTSTVSARGGQASFRFRGDRVELLWATPADGFNVEVLDKDDDEVELVFRSRDHTSVVKAKANDGDPEVSVDEKADSKSDRTSTSTFTVSAKGGQAGFRFRHDRVELLWTTPAEGFTFEVRGQDEDKIELVFQSPDHQSEMEAKAHNGEAEVKIDEASIDN